VFAENQTKGDKEEEKTRIVNNRTDRVTFGNLTLVFRRGGRLATSFLQPSHIFPIFSSVPPPYACP